MNMAIDEAIFESYDAARSLPTLRFYTWSPAALSLGYSQPIASAIDLARCHTLGLDVVRRPTGGRAVLHDHEVTYSLVINADHPTVNAGVLAAYLTVSRALIRGLALLGVAAELLPLRGGAALPSDPDSPVCFATPSSYEVAVAGRKVVGSAQRRARGVVMQHGSIPISWNRDKLRAVFPQSSRVGRSARDEADRALPMTSLQEAGGRRYDYTEVVSALMLGIAETWQVELIPEPLTPAECHYSAVLCATKYSSESWTRRR
jgi:lipoate-protein ligase A